ncbi:Ger(x)C family spore germination protein [Tepidibacter formicigenes]|jgi:Ger(x)C family germination protein|uniref:Germination protein, Ger(X)C family n=1 Tax=Tepidibacter formicigenes DSM 15518 TaxID=1123349 RepID=A0A1M6SVH0_9FIRM|nr:Ger(x)C family spore germination protein [Tepidibacter formicigenes]SHK48732.1 germination protein, Ger(x)C family [Tepidibacter formicigenes DSM 15518]
MKRKILAIFSAFFIIALLSGCWDKIEINARGFVIGLGIDKLSEKEKKKESDSIKVSFKIPNVALLGNKQSLTKEPSFYWESKGETFDTVLNEIQSRSPFDLDLSHNKVIILGEDLLINEDLFREVMDGIVRNKVFSRKMFILASKQNASDIIKVKPTEQPIIGAYYVNILTSAVKNGTAVDSTLNKVIRDIQENKVAVLPLTSIVENKKRTEIEGSAILKDYKLVGELSDEESRYLNMITKKNYNVMDIHVNYKNVPVAYNITSTSSKLKVREKDNNLVLEIYIETEGDITQHKLAVKGLVANDKGIREVEKLVEKKMEDNIKSLIIKLQKDYNADAIGVHSNIYKFNPKLYKKISDDWDHYFATMELNIKVNSKIRRIGIVR